MLVWLGVGTRIQIITLKKSVSGLPTKICIKPEKQ